MHPIQEHLLRTRRNFLTTTASGIGTLALASLLRDEGLLAAEKPADPLAPKPPHFKPRAKNVICVFMAGAPSQLDLFDPKPKLNELAGQKLPDSLLEKVRFAFIQKDGARLMGTPRKFTRHGQCGMELSDLLPHIGEVADEIALIRSMHTEEFNHHPGQLMMLAGRGVFGLPTMGSWLNYGLGSECRDLPGYVVLTAGRGTSGGASLWSSGFMPSDYAGVLFRSDGEAVLNLKNPDGLSEKMQQDTIEALGKLNAQRHEALGDPEIQSRVASYELAFRMQTAAPDLIDISDETEDTLKMYGVGREDMKIKAQRGGGAGQFHKFAKNCLLARRLVERGVRCVSLFHASWDHHSNLDNELKFNSAMADQPIAALIKDLKQRGMLDDTLVLWLGEFGRTPLGENRAGRSGVTGRDHHPFAFSIWAAGGGIRGGQVIGSTDEIGWNVAEDKMHVNDFHATLLHLFGLNHEKLTYRFQGRDYRLTDVAGEVVEKLIA